MTFKKDCLFIKKKIEVTTILMKVLFMDISKHIYRCAVKC